MGGTTSASSASGPNVSTILSVFLSPMEPMPTGKRRDCGAGGPLGWATTARLLQESSQSTSWWLPFGKRTESWMVLMLTRIGLHRFVVEKDLDGQNPDRQGIRLAEFVLGERGVRVRIGRDGQPFVRVLRQRRLRHDSRGHRSWLAENYPAQGRLRTPATRPPRVKWFASCCASSRVCACSVGCPGSTASCARLAAATIARIYELRIRMQCNADSHNSKAATFPLTLHFLRANLPLVAAL